MRTENFKDDGEKEDEEEEEKGGKEEEDNIKEGDVVRVGGEKERKRNRDKRRGKVWAEARSKFG